MTPPARNGNSYIMLVVITVVGATLLGVGSQFLRPRPAAPPLVIPETRVTTAQSFAQLLLDHRRRNVPLSFRNILADMWPAVEKWRGIEGARYLATNLNQSETVELDGDIPEQHESPIIISTLGKYVDWLIDHPTRKAVEEYRRESGLLPSLAEWKVGDGNKWDFTDEMKGDVKDLSLFAHKDLGLYAFDAFLWWSPVGGKTGLHSDLEPFSVLAQVVGSQNVSLWNPTQRPHLYPGNKYDRGAVLSQVDVWEPQVLQRFPDFPKNQNLTITLRAGDILYVPNGWWHTTETVQHSVMLTANFYTKWDWFTNFPSKWNDKLHHFMYDMGWVDSAGCTCHGSEFVYGLPEF